MSATIICIEVFFLSLLLTFKPSVRVIKLKSLVIQSDEVNNHNVEVMSVSHRFNDYYSKLGV